MFYISRPDIEKSMPDLKFSVYALVEEFLGLQETQLQQEKKLIHDCIVQCIILLYFSARTYYVVP